MESKKYKYEFAEIDGKNEIISFLDSLNENESAKIKAYMDKLILTLDINPLPNMKLSKYLYEGIFELRVPLTNRISRCLYFFIKDKTLIFTNGFIKKTEKTPINEIEKAIKIKNQFLRKIS